MSLIQNTKRVIEAPVKLVLFVLSSKSVSPDLYQRLELSFGPIDYQGSEIPFEETHYYGQEFGTPLYRQAFSFKNLVSAHKLSDWKLISVQMEKEFLREHFRIYNLDIGYVDTDKLVLGSLKHGGKKVYLGEGVYGDMLLSYGKGKWTPFEWAFLDFKDNRYHKDLERIREKYKVGLKALHK